MIETYNYEDVSKISDFILKKANIIKKPEIGIVCGSGLGNLVNSVKNTTAINYKDIPNFPISTVHGHAGRLVFGTIGTKHVVCMQGRFHAYEGYPMNKVTLPIRVMKLLGIQVLVVTNACGGLNQDFNVGDVMIIKDHICLPSLAGNGPLVGPNEDKFGERFTALSDSYELKLRTLAHQVAKDLKYDDFIREGVYCMQLGPFFETIAECIFMKTIGADVCGMSTAPEVMVARHCGLRVLGLSLVTNKAVLDYNSTTKANHQEVLETARARGEQMCKLVAEICQKID